MVLDELLQRIIIFAAETLWTSWALAKKGTHSKDTRRINVDIMELLAEETLGRIIIRSPSSILSSSFSL